MMVKAVIFDVDGTLVDTNDLHAASWAETFRRFGHEVAPEAVRGQIGKGSDQLMPVFLPRDVVEQRGEEIADARTALFLQDYVGRARAFPGVRPLFQRLREAGQRIVLASSAKGEELARYRELLGVDDLIDEATTSDDAESSKPAPDIFQVALRQLAPLKAAEAVVVGDTPYDAEAAGKAGLRTIGLLCGGFPAAALREAGCIALYRDPADLLAQLDRSPLAAG
ncbi:HAD family hydrolase [Siccirubricoccus sp. KC 17139]|uniref:HAD family hydrolase n=1 Tax=Siccirubricoccus soli TaxID=2899147 RepID=A0ABT1DD33_9PROT|nr:HAD family hydrolase [Siccirubricoccus soli]MCO6419507.1 HAD family hydrolase [Siccirubricoccus soli]MCP2685642.1 HAD family hydrolase [Siccirubricoccus soli]